MIKAVVKKGDGMRSQAWLGSVVKHVQVALNGAGYKVDTDGQFGASTESAASDFQKKNGLPHTGQVEQKTWASIDTYLPKPDSTITDHLDQFHGDLEWVHALEGHKGFPYWPGGNSGITIDPGVDLGQMKYPLFCEIYSPLLSKEQIALLEPFFGIKGDAAEQALASNPQLKDIKITSSQAVNILPYAAERYWNGITGRFPTVGLSDTPASIQTVMLSLSYNRGFNNKGLEVLNPILQNREWERAGQEIGKMQQDHKSKGIRIRRQQEGLIVKAEMDFFSS